MNFFLPFRRLEPNHENQRTRALLVVLRYSPMAHAAWLRLVAPERHLQQLPAAEFRTQTRAVRYAEEEDEPADLVSVFLTPEAPLSGGDVVITESDRTQVLDAVVDYGGELLVVIENKVAEDDDRQARELNITGARIRLADGQEAVVVVWRDLLEAFIALRERNLVAGAEALLLDDFLLYGGLLPRPWPVSYAAPCARQLVPADAAAASAPRRGGRSRRDDRLLRPVRRDARWRGGRCEDVPAHDRRRRAR